MPALPLPSAVLVKFPKLSEPIALNDTELPLVELTKTPSSRFPEMTLPAPDAPPIVLLDAPLRISTPSFPLWRDTRPVTSRPIKLPATTLFDVFWPVRTTPLPVFPEMTLRADAVVPPIVLCDAVPVTSTPSPLFGTALVPEAS